VDLVHYHEAESPEKGLPLLVKREQAEVEHIRVGDDEVGKVFLDASPLVRRSIAVIDRGTEPVLGWKRLVQGQEALILILGQGLEGKQVESMTAARLPQGLHEG
jgi:hypothetical protein